MTPPTAAADEVERHVSLAVGERATSANGTRSTVTSATKIDPSTRANSDTERWEGRAIPVPHAWYADPPPNRHWLLRDSRHPQARGVFPLGKVGQLIAEGGAGKTVVLTQLAVAVASGTPWLNTFETTPGRVLLVLGEEDADEARRRLHHAARVRGIAPENGSIEVLPLAGVLCAILDRGEYGGVVETPFLHWLSWHVESGGFRLVVIDPLSRFAGPDAERDNAIATRFVQALESLTAADRSVLNAHHVNKPSRGSGVVDGSSGRGSTAFVDGARWQCALSLERLTFETSEAQARLGDVVTFAVTKSNYAAKPDSIVLRRSLDHGGVLVPVDEMDRAMIEIARAGTPVRAAKSAARAAEREELRAERDRTEAERRATKDAMKEEADRRRNAEDDAAAREIVAAHPAGTAIRRLVPFLRAQRACGAVRAHAALVRVMGAKA